MTERCDTTRASLSAYVDGELPPNDAAAVAEHLTTCAACSAEYETMLETVGLLRTHLKRYTAPDVLRARVRTALASTPSEPAVEDAAQLPPSRRRARIAGWTRTVSWAAVVLVAAALGSGISMFVTSRDRQASPSTAAEVMASHVRSLMPDHLTDVRSSDQHNVKPWFNGRLDFSPSVPRLEEQGFPLLGGRLDYVDDRPVAVVVYGRRQHIINVYSWPTAATDTPPTMTMSHGYALLHWRSHGSEHWVVSDLNAGELQSFAALLRGADSASSAAPR